MQIVRDTRALVSPGLVCEQAHVAPRRRTTGVLTAVPAAVTVACMPGSDTASFVDLPDGDVARAVAASPPGQAAAAESELYRRFARRIRLFGLKHLRDSMAADDLAQQVMLIAIERLRA